MEHGVQKPELEKTPESRLFNVDAMSDEEIVTLSRGLLAMFNEGPGGEDFLDPSIIGDKLRDKLVSEVQDLGTRDPERVKNLAHKCARSQNEADQEFAAYVAPGIAHFDYDFARDVLVYLMLDPEDQRNSIGWGPIREVARDKIAELMRDQLTP